MKKVRSENMKFLQRVGKVVSFITGDFIVLMPVGDTLVVDCGKTTDPKTLKTAAALFFRRAAQLK